MSAAADDTVQERLYALASAAIDSMADKLRETSAEIWKKPELGMREHFAHSLLTQQLEEAGFSVTPEFILNTGFRATYSRLSGGRNVAFLCEYDALPEIGHACGHNLIAEAGLAAGIGLKAALESSRVPATVTVLGTPDEESSGGKTLMIKHGCLDGVDAALMVHPDRYTAMRPICLASDTVLVTFHGHASHAAAAPWEGINALDAAVSAYTSLSLLRQQMKPSWRVHAVIVDGGVKPNIIPEKAVLEAYVRAPTLKEFTTLKDKVNAILSAAAEATGCQADIVWPGEPYLNVRHNSVLVHQFQRHLSSMGETETTDEKFLGECISTDMGNVSHIVPSIHPKIDVSSKYTIHTKEFCAAANTSVAHNAIIRAAKAMAMCAVDLLTDPQLLETAKKELHNGEE